MDLVSAGFPALGSTAHVAVLDAPALDEAIGIVELELEAIDLACSRFRDDSELAALTDAAGKPVRVSPLLLEALEVAVEAAERTGGDVDPTVGGAMTGLGWDRDFTVVVSRGERPTIETVPAAGWCSIRIDRERRLVRIPAGVEIDLGATAKALCADRCASAVTRATGVGALVSLGGDIAVSGPVPQGGWPVRVTDDHRNGPEAPGQTIALHSGGLATSSTTVRRWRAAGAEQHHIVDPRTGLPAAEVWRTVSVAAGTCVAANTATTAAIVRGGLAPVWLESDGLSSRLVRRDGTVTYTGSWPEETR